MSAVTVAATRPRAGLAGLAWLRERGMGATVLVAAISSAFGVLLLTATGYIAAWAREDPYLGDSATVEAVLGILSVLLVGVAVYVAAVVTANTFATIIAGRTRHIAMLRLIGASARAQRREVGRQGLGVGLIGAAVGLVGGTLAAVLLARLADALLAITTGYAVVQPALVLPAAVVALTTWAGAWSGSRRVLAVTPLEALGGSAPRTQEQTRSRARTITTASLLVTGAALLAGGILVGLVSPLGVIVAFFGGILSFTGLALGAVVIMPPLLRLTGRLFGNSPTARIASENALRYPERSSRMAIGVVMGVTLVVMFAVASESVKAVMTAASDGNPPAEMSRVLDTFAAIMMGLVAVSAVIAAVGLVNLLTIGVVQRRRELGLLRALGLTSVQIRRMVLLEAVHVTVTALAFGVASGVVYGWVAAQSLLGSVSVPPVFASPTIVAPAAPWMPVLIVVVATAALTAVATVVPTRLATRVTAVEALAD